MIELQATDQSARAGDGNVPAGFALVPLTPTTGMVSAWLSTPTKPTAGEFFCDAYAAMLAAAPAAAPAAGGNERKPLTWEQFKTIVQELYGETGDTSMDDASAHDIEGAMAVVRAVERAHGIQAPATVAGSQP